MSVLDPERFIVTDCFDNEPCTTIFTMLDVSSIGQFFVYITVFCLYFSVGRSHGNVRVDLYL